MIEETLFALLSPLVNGRVYPDYAPFNTVRPFITYQNVGGVTSNSFCGDTDAQNAHIQVNVWAEIGGGGRKQANTIMRAVAFLISGQFPIGVALGGLVSDFDDVTKAYGARQDFSIWHTSLTPLVYDENEFIFDEDGNYIFQE